MKKSHDMPLAVGYYNLKRWYGITKEKIEAAGLVELKDRYGWMHGFRHSSHENGSYIGTVSDLKKFLNLKTD